MNTCWRPGVSNILTASKTSNREVWGSSSLSWKDKTKVTCWDVCTLGRPQPAEHINPWRRRRWAAGLLGLTAEKELWRSQTRPFFSSELTHTHFTLSTLENGTEFKTKQGFQQYARRIIPAFHYIIWPVLSWPGGNGVGSSWMQLAWAKLWGQAPGKIWPMLQLFACKRQENTSSSQFSTVCLEMSERDRRGSLGRTWVRRLEY